MLLASLTFAPLDWLVVALFVAAIMALGLSARLRDSSLLQYLSAGRNLSLGAFVATLVSTWYGGILGIGESVSYYGFGTWLLFGVPYYVFALIYAYWLAPKIRGGEQISIPERLHARWGSGAGLVGAVLVFLLAVPAAHVLMLGVLIREVSGWSSIVSLVAGGVVGTLFLYKGGLLADVRAGILAFLMMYIGFGAIVVYCLLNYPLVQTLSSIENKPLLTFTGGSGWPVIVSMFILGAWTIADPGFYQRVTSAKSPETGRRGVLVSVGFWFLFDVLSITTAMYAMALLKPLPTDTKAIFPALGQAILPAGLKAVFFCGMLGTITSAMVGYTLVSGASLGREIVGRLRPAMSDASQKLWTRIGFGVATVLAIIVAANVDSVVDLWYSWAGAMVGSLLIPVCLGYAAPRASHAPSWAIKASMILAAGLSLAWLFYGLRTNNAFLQVNALKIDGSWRIVLPPVPDDLSKHAADTFTFGVGTLLPGLVISALVIGVGEIVGRKVRKA